MPMDPGLMTLLKHSDDGSITPLPTLNVGVRIVRIPSDGHCEVLPVYQAGDGTLYAMRDPVFRDTVVMVVSPQGRIEDGDSIHHGTVAQGITWMDPRPGRYFVVGQRCGSEELRLLGPLESNLGAARLLDRVAVLAPEFAGALTIKRELPWVASSLQPGQLNSQFAEVQFAGTEPADDEQDECCGLKISP